MSGKTALQQEACEACRGGVPSLDAEAAEELLQQLPEWEIKRQGEIMQLYRVYTFPDFAAALAFTNQVGEMAESLQHHPDILTAWGRVELIWYTHKIGGLHRNDFRCAARSDALYMTDSK